MSATPDGPPQIEDRFKHEEMRKYFDELGELFDRDIRPHFKAYDDLEKEIANFHRSYVVPLAEYLFLCVCHVLRTFLPCRQTIIIPQRILTNQRTDLRENLVELLWRDPAMEAVNNMFKAQFWSQDLLDNRVAQKFVILYVRAFGGFVQAQQTAPAPNDMEIDQPECSTEPPPSMQSRFSQLPSTEHPLTSSRVPDVDAPEQMDEDQPDEVPNSDDDSHPIYSGMPRMFGCVCVFLYV